MNVNPNLLAHPKFAMYKAALGDPSALEYLLRLWGHCQRDQRGENWGRMPGEYVEAICGWAGVPGRLFECLKRDFCGRPGWVTVTESAEVVVTNWEEHNQALLKSWRNGGKGGRPPNPTGTRRQPGDNPRVSPSEPTGYPQATRGKPHENPIGVDLTGLDVSGKPRTPANSEADGAGEPDEKAAPKFSEIPTVAEVVAHGNGPAGIPAEYCRHYHEQKEIRNSWITAQGRLVNWKLEIMKWWSNDRATPERWNKKTAVAAGGSAAQWEAELESERDPQKRRELRKKIEEGAGV